MPSQFYRPFMYLITLIVSMNIFYCCVLLKPKRIAPTVQKVSVPSFWDAQRKGANFFNRIEKRERFLAAKQFGLEWVRLTPSKWQSQRKNSKTGDFLLGDRKRYTGLVKEDVEYLRTILDAAQKVHMRVVLTFLDLPFHYWSQHNGGKQDRRLWEDKNLWPHAIDFLVDMVKEFSNHPAIAAFDLLNEPSPEKTNIQLQDWLTDDYAAWQKKIESSSQDLNAFYKAAISAIRKIDPDVPIIVETGYYATPWGIKALIPIDDNNVLYSIHMYEPFLYTFQHRDTENKFTYPGVVPYGEIALRRRSVIWDKSSLRDFLKPVIAWQQQFNIPSNRIVVGEFGVNRFATGAPLYLKDLIEILDENRWHWAFYSFREDEWQMMDYELGQNKPKWQYWQALEKKEIPTYPDAENAFTAAIKKSLRLNELSK